MVGTKARRWRQRACVTTSEDTNRTGSNYDWTGRIAEGRLPEHGTPLRKQLGMAEFYA
jgi:hypothetical protein